MSDASDPAAGFDPLRPQLMRVAYRMLGSVADAEDVVQEAFIRWMDTDRETVREPGAFLRRTVTRLCLDQLKSAHRRREVYVGPWLPEPVVEDEIDEDVTLPLLFALERLSPLERAAFLLHDVFDVGFDEVVETLQQINSYIISFVRGQMLVSLIDGIILGIALKLMGLPYAITIAAAAALLGIIPYIGMISTSIPALLIAWFTWHDVSYVVGVAAIFICVSQFDGWVIQPRVIGNRVGMHDLTIMFSVLFWSLVLGGVVGALLAVPLTAAIKVLFIRYVWSSVTPSTPTSQPSPDAAPQSPPISTEIPPTS